MEKNVIVKGKIANAITSVAKNHIVATADDIFDENQNKYQNEINKKYEENIAKMCGDVATLQSATKNLKETTNNLKLDVSDLHGDTENLERNIKKIEKEIENIELAWGQITGDINEQTDLMVLINSKQNKLTAGTNIKIEGDVISNTYEYDDSEIKGDVENIEKEIENIKPEWGQITGDINSQNDLMSLINSKQNNLAAGTNIKIEGDVISNTYEYDDSGIKSDIENIEKLIPTQATEQNKLADKDFVNSTVASSAANFRGLWNNWADVPTNADDYPEDYVGNKKPTHNDYLTIIDASDYTGLEAQQYRFYYVGEWDVAGKSGWMPQYKIGVNFTAAQQAAIDSNITAAKVTEIDAKQNILTAGNGITINNDVISAEMDIIDVTGSQTISPNRLYVFGSVDSAIAITKGTDVQNKINCYCVRFTIATGGTVTFSGFGTIKWNGSSNQPTFKVGKTYEINIENGYAFYGEF